LGRGSVLAVALMRGFEVRLRRLEGGGGCPRCEGARRALLESIAACEPEGAPTRCEGCGRDVRPTVYELDELLESEGGGG
jgi:NAD-dependent SIR2 family protein deacetylase